MRFHFVELPCSPVPDHDSRGPGWYCCQCNTWNQVEENVGTPAQVPTFACRACGHRRCP